mmetsp:Transcript_20305/g.51423  ORF Transcript_20305/g.51423 Transcript_20305/m.51423 type:complete len:170 (-) Transcript_20305:247-756(-)
MVTLGTQGARNACTSATEGSSITTLISAVKASNSSTFAAGGLSALKSTIQPAYPACKKTGFSTQYKLLLGAAAGWFLYRADTQARSHDWIVDLSLDVLQAAWLISYASFLPFRSIVMAFRGLAPHTATPINALRPAIALSMVAGCAWAPRPARRCSMGAVLLRAGNMET